ncbi:MAG TPA: hypothetical protein VGC32_08635 [Solirubrobacterales bacterium]
MLAALAIPFAHLGHWTWIFYAIPLLIIVAGILRSTHREKKREREEGEGRAKRPRRRAGK